ncbi:hypothetical protein DW094_04240 [Ruminococcaceae bacterium AM07-15]|nr:hypothetical protein DW094_04240 [Ruminococcaceae bacterium AM07-15]
MKNRLQAMKPVRFFPQLVPAQNGPRRGKKPEKPGLYSRLEKTNRELLGKDQAKKVYLGEKRLGRWEKSRKMLRRLSL